MPNEEKKQSILQFFGIICERYENVKYFILKDSNKDHAMMLSREISKICINKNFIIN
jgi:hypothetical protein